METPKISIITVGMNHLNYLKDLLPSVYNNITPPYLKNVADWVEMIYVDNCSTDGSIESHSSELSTSNYHSKPRGTGIWRK